MKRLAIHNLSVKEVRLSFNSSPEQIDEFKSKLDEFGVKVYSVGLLYMKLKSVGVKLIVAALKDDLFPHIERKKAGQNEDPAVDSLRYNK